MKNLTLFIYSIQKKVYQTAQKSLNVYNGHGVKHRYLILKTFIMHLFT